MRPHRNDGSQEDAKQEQPADGGLLSYTKNFRKNFVYFSKNIPGGSFTIKKCFDRIKAQFIHSQSSNAKTVSRYLGEDVARCRFLRQLQTRSTSHWEQVQMKGER